MVDINPAALSRPSVKLSTPVLSTKSINVAPALSKTPKTSQLIPSRIDLEPLYVALKGSLTAEQWTGYKETTTKFLIGRLNQAEFSQRIDPIISSPDGQKEHLHNQLIAAIFGNVTREMPDQVLAPWVSANDKPSTSSGSKPLSGDAAERRLKGEVMQLPSRDRRRLKDLANNDFDPYDAMANVFSEHHKARISKAADPPASAGGFNRMNLDLEIRKRFVQPLAIESGEFPDVSNIESRMLPFCYEAGLTSGHATDAAQFLGLATETFIKEMLSQVFSRTRSNPPGDSGTAGLGPTGGWISTHKYKRQLAKEEVLAQTREATRDKSGLLPVEAKAASERGPVGMADLMLALDIGDCNMSNFSIISKAAIYGYREGELEHWNDYTWFDHEKSIRTRDEDDDVEMGGAVNGKRKEPAILPNGVGYDYGDKMDIDDDAWWDGASNPDGETLDGVLDSCLAAG